MYGLKSEEWQTLEENLIQPLKEAGAKVWIFGSRARGDSQPFSDIDIMVDSDSISRSKLESIREYFQKSNFPYKVDLVHINDFASSYVVNFEAEKKAL